MNKKLSQSLQDWSAASIHASYPPPSAFSRTKFILLYSNSQLLDPKLSDSKKGSDFQDDFFA